MAQRDIPTFTIFVNGVEANYLQPISIQRSTGGGRLDWAQFEIEPAAPIVDLEVLAGGDLEIELHAASSGFETRVLHWGKVSRVQLVVQDGIERRLWTSRVEPFHFGEPIFGEVFYHPAIADHLLLDVESIGFNPLIDGVIEPNMRASDPLPNGVAVFFDPTSGRTQAARDVQQSEPALWVLSEVVYYLCWMGNPAQQFIRNPTRQELESAFDNARDLVRDLRLDNGLYLPEALDRVLGPYGYDWYLALAPGERTIRFYRRGSGTSAVTVRMQRPGEDVAISFAQAAEIDLQYDLSELVNDVTGLGNFIEVESTFELVRAWPASSDSLANTPEKLAEDDADFATNRDVWRKWVLNEAGDYVGLRTEIAAAHNFTALADEIGAAPVIPKRRRFLPTITLGDDREPVGKISGCVVQYWSTNEVSASSGEQGWTTVTQECQVLENECGVYFSGLQPPEEIIRHGADAKVRITASVRLDERITARSVHDPQQSAQAQTVAAVLDLPHFSRRVVATTSIYASEVESGAKPSRQADDRAALAEYVARLKDAWDLVRVGGPVEVEGVDRWEFELGQAMTEIAGRSISLAARPAGAQNQRYPQIVGITYDVQRQRTTLELEEFRGQPLRPEDALLRVGVSRVG